MYPLQFTTCYILKTNNDFKGQRLEVSRIYFYNHTGTNERKEQALTSLLWAILTAYFLYKITEKILPLAIPVNTKHILKPFMNP